jgi:cellulose synthase (UDP-forming)
MKRALPTSLIRALTASAQAAPPQGKGQRIATANAAGPAAARVVLPAAAPAGAGAGLSVCPKDDRAVKAGSRNADTADPMLSSAERCHSSGERSSLSVASRREVRLTWLGILVMLGAFAAFLAQVARDLLRDGTAALQVLEGAVYVALVSLLVYGALVYLCARHGYLRRVVEHRRGSRAGGLPACYDGAPPHVVMLVPSYKEDARVVRQTLLSAALQDHPNKAVVLLIDDPPRPTAREDSAALAAVRALPHDLAQLLAEPAACAAAACLAFERRRVEVAASRTTGAGGRAEQCSLVRAEAARAAAAYREIALWLDGQARRHPVRDHTDAFFAERILRATATAHRRTADALEARVPERLDQLDACFRRLGALFDVQISSFERKRFANLSHAPNKAMNLNAYIALMGTRRVAVRTAGDLQLVAAREDEPGREFLDAPYILTLDADSLLLPGYTSRLIDVMQRPGNERVAVAQTPYSAIPGAPSALERVAGATTDMQYIVHQGLSANDATYWVGANALLRKAALETIATDALESGRLVRKFIQDRTVIEDTESSIDLVARGWRLYNHPQRLAYSATPPDYGALVIQRRRWANGGLIILPKLLRYLAGGGPTGWRRVREGWMRIHYLTSIATANVGFLALVLFPFGDWLSTAWLPLAAAPYFVLYARDLRHAGYRRRDALGVYALNILLLAANLAGVAKSLHQAGTGRQTPFKRTPKVARRTAAPALYVALPLALALYLCLGMAWDVVAGRWGHAAIELTTAALMLYALASFIGRRAIWQDLTLPVRRLGKDARRPSGPPHPSAAPARP